MSWPARFEQLPTKATEPLYDLKPLSALLEQFPETKFIFVQWIDLLGQMRTRCFPTDEFKKLVWSSSRFAVSKGNLGTLENDGLTPVCDPVGSILVEPDLDLASLRPMQRHGTIKGAATIMARYVNKDGDGIEVCPRAAMQRVVEECKYGHGVELLVGFEIEVVFCKRAASDADDTFIPLDDNHAWSTMSDEQYTTSLPTMLTIATALKEIGIPILQMHSESAPGQYEFVLPPLPAIYAVDALMQARQCIRQIAATFGLLATFHPQPFDGIGTAAHAHISFNEVCRQQKTATDIESQFEPHFIAGVLEHLPSICVFTMPQPVSYNRVQDSGWMSGTWAAWGTQNREVPLRKSGQLRWEFRCIDGFANMYLALHSIIAAGLRGVKSKMDLQIHDCRVDPASLTEQQRAGLGISRKLPNTLETALANAEKDAELKAAMSPGILEHFLAMKKAEQVMLAQMEEDQRRKWLMDRY